MSELNNTLKTNIVETQDQFFESEIYDRYVYTDEAIDPSNQDVFKEMQISKSDCIQYPNITSSDESF